MDEINHNSLHKLWWVYIIVCTDNSLYTGITNNLIKRWQQHNATAEGIPGSRGAKFFRSRKPSQVVYLDIYPDRGSASKEESRIKSLPRSKKLILVKYI